MAKKRLFRIQFYNQGKLYQIYARRVVPGSLPGFVEVAELVFSEASALVIDPSEERLKSEFEGVSSTYIPMHAVIRIDEVVKQGSPRILSLEVPESNVIPYPFRPGGPKPET